MKWRRRLRQQLLGGGDAKVRPQRSDRHRRIQRNNGRRMRFNPATGANKDPRRSCSLVVQSSGADLLPFHPSVESDLHGASPGLVATPHNDTSYSQTFETATAVTTNSQPATFVFPSIQTKISGLFLRVAHQSSALFHFQ